MAKKPEPAREPVTILLNKDTRKRLRHLAADAECGIGRMIERLVDQAAKK